jgi:hypothetical protein
MISEEIEAGLALQALALTGGLGLTAQGSAKVVSHGRYVTFQLARWRCRDKCSRKSCR